MSQIKDIFFIKTILDRATAGSHNGEIGYYSVSDNMFSEGHSCYCDNGNDYYSDLKGIFDCDSTLSGWGSYYQTMFDAGQLSLTIVKMAANNYLSILVGGQNVSLNFDGNYYYTQNNYCCYGSSWWRWDYINGELTNYTQYSGGSYTTIPENVETTLYSSMPIIMYYNSANRNINYAQIAGDQGVGSGGWQVPNPNPTRKIVLNGSEPDDIKLNGVTPDKIMLNGNCYFEKPFQYLYKWDFTKSLTDEIQSQTAALSGATQDSNGLHFSSSDHKAELCPIDMRGKTIEIDISSIDWKGGSSHISLITTSSSNDPCGILFYWQNNYWTARYWNTSSGSGAWSRDRYGINTSDMNGHTIKLVCKNDSVKLYIDDVAKNTVSIDGDISNPNNHSLIIGKTGTNAYYKSLYDMTITGVRIYANEE